MIPSHTTPGLADSTLTASFELWAREAMRERVQTTALVMSVIFTLAFFLELALGNEQVEQAGGPVWNLVFFAICATCWVAMRKLPLARTSPTLVAAPLYFLVPMVGGAYLSSMGGFDGPFFYAVYAIAPLMIYLPCALPQRIVLTLGMIVSFCATYIAPHPEYLRYPLIHIPATYLVMGSACSIALGHLGYGLMREHFVMGQLLLQKNETLIARVEQTSSVVGTLIQHLDATRKAERTKIARTLHDELGQLIVGARMKISNIERRFHKHGPDQTSTALTSDLESLAELMEELNVSSRDLLTELRTKEERNLEQRINALVEPLSDQKDLVVRVEFQASNESFPEDVEECIYRTIQEALTNVVKHAGSCDVSISVNLAETDAVVVTGQETGAGFEQAVIPAGSSWGLVGMRERVEEANGTLSIVSGASGTQISVRLPLPKGGSY